MKELEKRLAYMAVSPVQNAVKGRLDSKSNVKARSASLALRANSNFQNGDGEATPSSAQDFAERLNQETREKYVKDRRLGEGTYAVVYLGYLRTDPSVKVAIKKIKVNEDYRDGLSMDAVREVKYLQELSHPNIIAMHAVFSSKNQNLNLVLEYLPLGDLEMLIRDTAGVQYGAAEIKSWMSMLARGVWFCHENFVLHRDIKPNNLFIAADGEVKLADFGLARSFADPYRPMTHQVITRWYRPPELLMGARYYSGAVDVWSVGMVFAELIMRVPFLAGQTDQNQLELIAQHIGVPSEDDWPGVSKLKDFVTFDGPGGQKEKTIFLSRFGTVGPRGVDLLMRTLRLDPKERSTAKQILQHEWWTNDPTPTPKESLPRRGGGPEKMGEDLKRKGGEIDNNAARGAGVARKLNF